MPPFSLAIRTSLKCLLLTYFVDIPQTTEQPNEVGTECARAWVHWSVAHYTDRSCFCGCVGNVVNGMFGSVAVQAFSAPQAAAYEDIPWRHPPRHFKNASNSQLITPTRRITQHRTPCPVCGQLHVMLQLAGLIDLLHRGCLCKCAPSSAHKHSPPVVAAISSSVVEEHQGVILNQRPKAVKHPNCHPMTFNSFIQPFIAGFPEKALKNKLTLIKNILGQSE